MQNVVAQNFVDIPETELFEVFQHHRWGGTEERRNGGTVIVVIVGLCLRKIYCSNCSWNIAARL